MSIKIAILNWIVLEKYKQKECADKKKYNVVSVQIWKWKWINIEMVRLMRNMLEIQKGETWKCESTQKGDMNLNVKMMIHETRKEVFTVPHVFHMESNQTLLGPQYFALPCQNCSELIRTDQNLTNSAQICSDSEQFWAVLFCSDQIWA